MANKIHLGDEEFEIVCDYLPTGSGEGGGYIVMIDTRYGDIPRLMAWDEIPGDAEPGTKHELYIVDVADDVLSDMDWALDDDGIKGISSFTGMAAGEIRRMATSANVCERAGVYQLIADYNGWHEIDTDPSHRSVFRMHEMLPDYFDEPELEWEADEAYGPDKDEPTSGLLVEPEWHNQVRIVEWTDIENATGEEQEDGAKVLKVETQVDLDVLMDPSGKHRGTYSGDMKKTTYEDLFDLSDAARTKAIVAAAIGYIGYYGGTEEYVDAVGD